MIHQLHIRGALEALRVHRASYASVHGVEEVEGCFGTTCMTSFDFAIPIVAADMSAERWLIGWDRGRGPTCGCGFGLDWSSRGWASAGTCPDGTLVLQRGVGTGRVPKRRERDHSVMPTEIGTGVIEGC